MFGYWLYQYVLRCQRVIGFQRADFRTAAEGVFITFQPKFTKCYRFYRFKSFQCRKVKRMTNERLSVTIICSITRKIVFGLTFGVGTFSQPHFYDGMISYQVLHRLHILSPLIFADKQHLIEPGDCDTASVRDNYPDPLRQTIPLPFILCFLGYKFYQSASDTLLRYSSFTIRRETYNRLSGMVYCGSPASVTMEISPI